MVEDYREFCLSGCLFTALSVAVVSNYFIPGFSIALGFLLGNCLSARCCKYRCYYEIRENSKNDCCHSGRRKFVK